MNDKASQFYICGIDRDVEISNRIAERNVPSRPLQPQFSQRPVSTKYALMPIIDRRAPATVPIHTEPTYSVGNVFNPGSLISNVVKAIFNYLTLYYINIYLLTIILLRNILYELILRKGTK